MEDDIFEKIIKREIPADIVYEDNNTIAFLDIRPNNPGHTLVVPKTHARNIFDIDDKTLDSLMHTVRRIAAPIRDAVNADGMNIIINNERAAGQIIFHIHLHLIPRFTDDGLKGWPHKECTPNEASAIAKKIRAKIA